MAALFDNSVLDAALDEIGGANALHVCKGTPTDYASAVNPSNSLASVTLDSGDFTKADHATSGRQITVAAQGDVEVDANGTPAYYCLVNTSTSTLLAMTEVDDASPDLTSGSTTDIPAVTFSVADPTVV